jgi:hypothetical protein
MVVNLFKFFLRLFHLIHYTIVILEKEEMIIQELGMEIMVLIQHSV